MSTSPRPDPLTVAQAAEELGVSTRRVRQFISQGRLEATLVSPELGKGYWVIPRRALARLRRRNYTFPE